MVRRRRERLSRSAEAGGGRCDVGDGVERLWRARVGEVEAVRMERSEAVDITQECLGNMRAKGESAGIRWIGGPRG